MKIKAFILCVLFLQPVCCFGSEQVKGSAKETVKSENSIVFGQYHTGKEKWKGRYHNRQLFPWFNSTTKARDEKEYRRLIDNQRKNGVKFIGYYYSATTSYSSKIRPDSVRFPETALPPEAIKSSWIMRDSKGQPVTWKDQKDRYFLDVGRKEVQDAILQRAIGNAKRLGTDVLVLDNWYYNYWAPGDMSVSKWTEKCLSFLIRARELTQQNNMILVVNTPSPPKNWINFASYLDGISYEMAAHPHRLGTRSLYERELSSYEKVLLQGKTIFLYTDTLTKDGKRFDEDGRKVAATAMLVMPKDQRHWGGIYVNPPRYEIWPVGGWPMWPDQLGKPLGTRRWTDNTVTREFEHGHISVTVGQEPKFSIKLEY